jgi:hypothetical protein
MVVPLEQALEQVMVVALDQALDQAMVVAWEQALFQPRVRQGQKRSARLHQSSISGQFDHILLDQCPLDLDRCIHWFHCLAGRYRIVHHCRVGFQLCQDLGQTERIRPSLPSILVASPMDIHQSRSSTPANSNIGHQQNSYSPMRCHQELCQSREYRIGYPDVDPVAKRYYPAPRKRCTRSHIEQGEKSAW